MARKRPAITPIYIFGSSKVTDTGTGGAIVLETSDLKHFYFAFDKGYNDQVFGSPLAIDKCNTDPNNNVEFDQNYAAPGSVVQDPTKPAGNLIIIYEAENHCPLGVVQQPFYATVGFATSSDNGKTWPAPVNSEFGSPDRHPVLKEVNPEPDVEPKPENMGDALPSAFVDRKDREESYLYVTYGYAVGPGNGKGDGLVRVARAKFDNDHHYSWKDHDSAQGDDGQLKFFKWYNGAFSEPGIGGLDSGVAPAPDCLGREVMSEINYNDDLGLYLLIFVCNSAAEDGYGSWFYSTATSLELQDWSVPQMIEHSRWPVTQPCKPAGSGGPLAGTGSLFDDFYPSFMSPGADAGHTKLTGHVFFQNGCDTGLPRAFTSRTFTITMEP